MNQDAQTLYQFEKCEHCDNQNSPYDYKSVMHYEFWSFSNCCYSGDCPNYCKPTITDKDGGTEFGNRNGFSALDIQGINQLYCGKLRTLYN